MNELNIEDYKLEISVLQLKDTQMAIDNGFNKRKDWYEFMIKQDYDEIAHAIIELAERYDLPITRVAHDFDPSMVMRIGYQVSNDSDIKVRINKQISKEDISTLGKAA